MEKCHLSILIIKERRDSGIQYKRKKHRKFRDKYDN